MDNQPYELSVREQDVGGGVLPEVRVSTPYTPQGRSRVVLLIHGYNNKWAAARESYGRFLDNFRAAWPQRPDIVENTFKFFWPGDKNWGPLSFASFPLEIAPAKESARVLGEFLAELAGPGGTHTELYIVAHSLGNRVLLELLEPFAQSMPGRVRVGAICLMAAAVPVKMVKPGGDLAEAARFTDTYTLYSPSDLVLHWGFPIGETLALEGFFPRAIGRFGEPSEAWKYRQQMVDSQDHSGYNHGDYWPTPDTTLPVGRMLGQWPPNDVKQSEVAENSLPSANAISANAIADRALPERPALG